MADPDISDREAAIATTIAARTLREDRKRAELEAKNAPSTRAVIISALFTAITSIGLLIAMLAMQ